MPARQDAARPRARADLPPLVRRLRDLGDRDGVVRFDRFMETVLYDPDHGYFATDAGRAGREGDFLTAPEVAPVFASVVWDWCAKRWRDWEAERWALVEVGAGRGTLAAGLVACAAQQGAADRLDLHLVERGAAARAALAAALPGAATYADAADLPPRLGPGILVANELFDNLPVRRVMQADGLQEVCVAVRGMRLREVLRPAPDDLARLVEAHGLRLREGESAEVCASAAPLLETVLGRLDPGAFLVFDYGGEANEVSGEAAPHGTLAAHRGHARHADVYAALGQQDVTAHVNFTPLREAARRLGYRTELVPQGRFLVREGLPDRLQALVASAANDFERLRLTQRAKQLYHPDAMGDAFKVLVGERIRDGDAQESITRLSKSNK